ncbi:MAG: hypothetical protein AB7U73_17350 [Pirellulales bacterium]
MHAAEPLAVYLHLARASAVRQRPLVRDRFLLLAASEASRLGLSTVAERCRQMIVEHNRGHLLARWGTYQAAATEPDFQDLLRRTVRQYSAEKSEHILRSLGIELAFDDVETLGTNQQAVAFLESFPDPHAPPPRAGVLARQRGAASDDWTDDDLDDLGDEPSIRPLYEAGDTAPAAPLPQQRSRLFDPPLGFPLAMVALFAVAALIIWLLTNVG